MPVSRRRRSAALTDHDETGGLDEAATAAAGSGLQVIAAVSRSRFPGMVIPCMSSDLALTGCSELLEGLRTLQAVRPG